MKKFLSLFLAVILVFSVISPITVFAENGPYPNDFENIDLENPDTLTDLKMSAIMFMDFGATSESIEEAIGLVYPADAEMPLPEVFSGASYDMETNTLTLKNVKSKTAILAVLGMGDDFKIKLEGYNELSGIMSVGMEWGGAITLIGNGELVLGRSEEAFITGLTIEADETASFFHVEDTVKLKFYSNPDFISDAVSISGSTITDPAEIIKLGGDVVGDAPVFEKYTVDFFEQAEAYDLEWNYYDWYEFGLKKDGVYYIADEEFNEETFEPTGKYVVYAVSFDELLGCYTLSEYDKVKSFDGFTIVTEFEPLYDENLGYYIGYTDYPDEEDDSYKTIFFPDEKEPFDLCVDENGTKYGFFHFSYEYDDGTNENITFVYNLIDHPTYGLVAVEDKSKTSLDGLTPLKIGEKDYADCYISSDLVINNGGSIIEPAKIKNIKATSTNQGVKITWSADPVADKYRIYRKVDGGKKWTRLDTIEADETSFIDKTAKSGKKYIYTVKGANFVGEGTFNSKGVTHTYYEAPDVTIKTTTKGVYLKWAKIAGATKYKIYRQTSGSSKWTLIDTVKGTSFTDRTAKSGKKYYYRVRSAKGDIMSGYNVVSKYFLSAPKLSSVKNSASGVKVEWKKVTGAEGYNVYRKSGSGSYKYIGKTSKLYYTDETAKSGTTYTYTVKAYKSKTESSYNSGLSCKYLAAPKVETKVYTSTIKVSWDKVSGAKEYAVYRKASGESKWTKLTTTTKTSYKDANVKNNKTYSYRVKAINGKTVSSYDTVKQLFLSTPKLSSVKNTDNGVKITWKKVSGAEGYKIYRKTGSGSFKLIGTTTNNKTYSYTDKDFEAGKTYTYTVKAYNGKYTSYYNTSGLKIKTQAPTIAKPSMNSLTNTEKGVQVAWMPVSGADNYYIYRQIDGATDWEQIAVVSESELGKDQYGYLLYVDETVENGTIYGYAVKACENGILSDYAYAPNRYMAFLTPVNMLSAQASADGVHLQWEANEYADGYVLQRKAQSEEEFSFINCQQGDTLTSAIDTSVSSGETYTYAIYARTNMNNGKDGWSAIGGTITVTVD